MNEYIWWAWPLTWRGVASSLALIAADVFDYAACVDPLV